MAAQSDENTQSYLVVLKEQADVDQFIEKKGLHTKKLKKVKNFNLLAVDLTDEEMEDIKNDSDTEFIEINGTVEATSIGQLDSNPQYVERMQNDAQGTPWGIEDIGILPALAENYNGDKIKVAVLDTGIAKHKDIKVAGGISFVEGVSDYIDDNGHGTHVAGTIAALDNNIGVVGAASGSDIYAVKVLNNNGTGNYASIIQGIDWAIQNDINIISMSLGGQIESDALHQAIIEASDRGILIIAAAGNTGSEENAILYPARFPEVVSVGAVDKNHSRASFSATGSELDLVAPGVDILSTTVDGEYGVLSGTSMATPHVTGAAATLWSSDNSMTNEEVKERLYETATSIGSIEEYGQGIINLKEALGLNTQDQIQPDKKEKYNKEKQVSISDLPFAFTGIVNDNDTISTTFQLLNDDPTYQKIELSIYEEGKKDPVYSNLLEVNTSPVVLNELEPDKEYKFNIRISTANNIVESYNGDLILNTKRLDKVIRYNPEKFKKYFEVKAQTKNIFLYITDLTVVTNPEPPVTSMAGTVNESESNNTYSSADLINDDDDVYGKISSSTDKDFYMVKFASSGKANFWLGSIPSGCDYDLYLLDSNGTTQLAQSINGGNADELISQYSVSANKWYYIKVVSWSGYNTSTYYHLRAKNYPNSLGDRYEPNGSLSAATAVSNNVTITDANIDNASDTDYFKFTLSASSNVSIALSNIPSGCDYDLKLYDSANVQKGSSTARSNASENIAVTLNSGTYYVKVYPYAGSSNSYYRLQITTTAIPQGDRYEPNETVASATIIPNNTTISDATIHTTTDWDGFKFTISATSIVTIDLSNIPAGCDYDVGLFDGSDNFIDSSTQSGTTPENLTLTLSPGTYVMAVWSGIGSSTSYYRLQLTSVTAPSPDRYEPNDATSAAASISSNVTIADANINTTLDKDYYKFTLSTNSTVTIDLSNIPAGCDYDIALYNSSNSRLARSTLTGNSPENITITIAAGTYYILVSRDTGYSGSYYKLQVNTIFNTPKLDVVGITSNSITLKAQYPRSGINGNELKWYNNSTGQWTNFPGTSSYTADGTYTLTGLTPLTTYQCSLIWYTDQTNSWLKRSIDINVQTHSENNLETVTELSDEVIQVLIDQGIPLHEEQIGTSGTEQVSGQWGTSDNNTHYVIANQAFTILKNDKGSAVYDKFSGYMYDVLEGASLPDDVERDQGTGILVNGSWVGHFYGPNGTNYLANYPWLEDYLPSGTTTTQPNAYQRFNNHFYRAVQWYKEGYRQPAYQQLGMALHYLSDLNAPHHAANRIAKLTGHTEYENWVDARINNYLVTSAAAEDSYSYVVTHTFREMADDWSSGARAQINNADNYTTNLFGEKIINDTTADIATDICVKRSQRAAAGLLYRFLANTGQL